jgi:hypothetical protein
MSKLAEWAACLLRHSMPGAKGIDGHHHRQGKGRRSAAQAADAAALDYS